MSENILTQTYIRLKDKFFVRAYSVLQNKNDADDALQEAFYKLWKGRYAIKDSAHAQALMNTTIKNISIDKKRKVRESHIEQWAQAANLEDEDSENEQISEKEEIIQAVEHIVSEQLTDIQQYIIRRKEYDGQTLEKIAAELNMKPPAVRMQLSRARQRIRECYNKGNMNW